jgi:hypothetical protein
MIKQLQNPVVRVALVVLIGLYIYKNYYRKQGFENSKNISKEDQELIDKIYMYFMTNKEVDFKSYLDFLISNNNKNLDIIDLDVFSTFKVLKKRDALTKNEIAKEMKL